MSESSETSMRKFTKVCEILKSHDYNPGKMIPILSAVQEEYRYLPEEVMGFIATSLDVPPANVYGVATFYSHFAFKPKGKHIIKICDGTACHVKKSIPILQAIRKHLDLKEDKITTDDMLFTVETVSCLGACGLAPVITIDDEVYGLLDEEKAVNIIKDVQKLESTKEVENNG